LKKNLKILGIAVGILIGVLLLSAVALTLLFDPNQYRGEVIRLVKDKTGRDLKINKKISWSFFPRLGIEAGGLALSNAPGFGSDPFARVDAAGVHVAVLPLLSGRVQVDSIYVHGLNLNLARDAKGNSNWAMTGGEPAAAAKEKQPDADSGNKRLPIEGLSIGALDVRRASIDWRDAASGAHYTIRNLKLDTGRFAPGVPMDMRLAFELLRDISPAIKASISSRLTARPDSLKLEKVEFRLDDSRLTGFIDVKNFASPSLRFDLALDRIDLDRYLSGGEPVTPAVMAEKPAPGSSASSGPAHASLRALNIDGKFAVKSLQVFGAKLSDGKISIQARDGLITLQPSSAKLYQGTYHGRPVLDARGKDLKIRLNEKLENVQVGPLLKDMKLLDHYTGTGNILLDLNATGSDSKQIRQSLTGRAQIAFHDGRIEGVDFVKLIEAARALSRKSSDRAVAIPATDKDSTVFNSFTASAQFAGGIARSEDIVLDGPNLRAVGKGKSDLVREKLDYSLRITIAEGADRRGTTLPVKVVGTFANPKFEADIGEYLKMGVEKQLKKNVGKELEKLLSPKKSRKQRQLEQQ